MAKYTLTHTCGHTETLNLGGPEKDRRRIVASAADKPCFDCRNAAQSAAAAAANTGLCELAGSPKQIAWAETIRAAARAYIEEALPKMRLSEIGQADAKRAIDRMFAQSDAKYWIDNRDALKISAIAVSKTFAGK